MKYLSQGIALTICLLSSTSGIAELRDPTRPSDYIANNSYTGPLVLSSIIISPDRRIAVINGVIVKVGEGYAGKKVISIDPNSVQLEGVDGRIMLYLVDSSVKEAVDKP